MGHESYLRAEVQRVMRAALRWNVRNRLLVAFLIVATVPLVVFGVFVNLRTANAMQSVERQQILADSEGAQALLADQTRSEKGLRQGLHGLGRLLPRPAHEQHALCEGEHY